VALSPAMGRAVDRAIANRTSGPILLNRRAADGSALRDPNVWLIFSSDLSRREFPRLVAEATAARRCTGLVSQHRDRVVKSERAWRAICSCAEDTSFPTPTGVPGSAARGVFLGPSTGAIGASLNHSGPCHRAGSGSRSSRLQANRAGERHGGCQRQGRRGRFH
jgi:hypothetical protein